MVVLFKEATMDLDLDTVLVTVYCLVDDLYQAHYAQCKPSRPGARPEMSDSEVLTLQVLAQWQPRRSEQAFLRHVRRQWSSYFPRLLSPSAFNRRARDLEGVLADLGPRLGRQVAQVLSPPPAYAVLDTVPVPLMRRCRGERHRCFTDEAAIGCGGSDRDWYYGVHLLTVVEASGPITGFVLGPANTEARWLGEAVLRWRADPTLPGPTADDLAPVLGPSHRRGGQRRGPTGPLAPRLGVGQAADRPYLGDQGFTGAAWQRHWRADYHALVLTKAEYATAPCPAARHQARRWFSGLRQLIETVNGCLTTIFGLSFPRARTYWGLLTRLAAKIAAFNLMLLLNYLANRPPLTMLALFD
jgi:hypothetical protein